MGPARGRKLGRVAGLDEHWGGSVRMNLGFKDRGRLMPSVRSLVDELCRQCLDSNERTQELVLAVQELVENLSRNLLSLEQGRAGGGQGDPRARQGPRGPPAAAQGRVREIKIEASTGKVRWKTVDRREQVLA